jgi:hypothetical protein
MRGLLLIARQRTGTNLLRSVLSRSSNLHDANEIFNPDMIEYPGNFWRFFRELYNNIPYMRDMNWIKEVFDAYFDYIEKEIPIPLLDLKYNSFWSLAPTWFSPMMKPEFIGRAMTLLEWLYRR